jgi:hypothetical protein
MRRLIFAILMICVPSGVFAQPPMQFRAFPPDRWYEALMGAHGWTIYASGTIDADADQRLDQIIQQSKIPFGSYIYLHSPGGDVLGGMKLGKVIRKYLLVTDVGQLDPNNTRTIESKPQRLRDGFSWRRISLFEGWFSLWCSSIFLADAYGT